MRVRRAIRIALVLGALGGPSSTFAEDIAGSVRVLVGTTPGGPADLLARLFSLSVATQLGRPFFVENKAGASGTVAARMESAAAPDGRTLLVAGISSTVAAPYAYRKLGYDPAHDLVPVGVLATSALVLVVAPRFPANDVMGLVSAARSTQPRQIAYGSSGNGSITHLCAEMLSAAATVEFQQIPFAGDGPASNSLLAGDTQFMFMAPNVALPLAKASRLKALAVTGPNRLSALPDVPTMSESGFPGYECRPWTMVFAPSGTPPEKVESLSQAWIAALRLPATRAQIEAAGLEPPRATGTAEAQAFLREQRQRLDPILQRAFPK